MSEKFVVLVVDDNPGNRYTLRALLSKLPECETVEAESGEEALLRTIELDIHLILLDVQMPGMDGFETARHLQMTERTRHIPIVFVTAVFKSDVFIQHGYAVGAIDYLTKPLDDNLLLNRVRLYQRVHHHQQELQAQVQRLKLQERELATSRDNAEAANRAKSIFLANMSHELRTPLNAILGFAQLIERDQTLPETHRRELATINRAGRHLLDLINDVLEISRIEAGQSSPHNLSFDLTDSLNSVISLIRGRADSTGLQFNVQYQGPLPQFVYGDAHRLRQVLLNLLGNAIKFTERGSITLRLNPLDDRIRFDVIDTGVGIAPEEQSRIFEAFYQTEMGVSKGEGTGLGLPISREFIRMMGGELTVSSVPGQGSVFSFTLPLPTTAEPTSGVPQRRIIGLADDQPSVRVLVAEDNTENAALITMLLLSVGFDVRNAKNGQLAIECFESWHPHFIWMDMRMPVMDGYEATRIIRSLPGGKDVKIAAVTASAFQENRDAILASGCEDILPKPVDAYRLFQIMGDLLGLRFRYDNDASSVVTPQVSEFGMDLSPLSAEFRAELAKAAELLDSDAIRAMADTLRLDHPDLARAIQACVDAYRFDVLEKHCRGTG